MMGSGTLCAVGLLVLCGFGVAAQGRGGCAAGRAGRRQGRGMLRAWLSPRRVLWVACGRVAPCIAVVRPTRPHALLQLPYLRRYTSAHEASQTDGWQMPVRVHPPSVPHTAAAADWLLAAARKAGAQGAGRAVPHGGLQRHRWEAGGGGGWTGGKGEGEGEGEGRSTKAPVGGGRGSGRGGALGAKQVRFPRGLHVCVRARLCTPVLA